MGRGNKIIICNIFNAIRNHDFISQIGNSGIFRPEMLLPMGIPEGVSVLAWGLSLERFYSL